jgi:hypothetical protein
MKRWFYNFILTPKLSSFEAAGTSAAVCALVTSYNLRGLLVAIAIMIGMAAIVAITTAIKGMK